MKTLLFGLTLSLTTSYLCFSASDCSNARVEASDLYSYAKKAYRAENLSELRTYAKKTKIQAEIVRIEVEACKCEDAIAAADDAVIYAKRAQNETSFEDASNYAKKAFRAAQDVETNLDNCDTKVGLGR